MTEGKKQQIIQLLGQGLPQAIVANAVGLDSTSISSMMEDEEFKAQVTAIRITKTGASVRRDDKINLIEDKILQALETNIDTRAPFMKTGELLTAFRVVNLARRRGVQTPDTSHEGVVVNLTLPKQHLDKFTMTITPEGEVIGVERQTLVTMSSRQVLDLLPEEDRKQAGRKLPSTHRVHMTKNGVGSV